MATPATVRVEELGHETSGYRDAHEERRRVVHVRGSSPRRAWFFLALAASTFAVAGAWMLTHEPSAWSWSPLLGLVAAILLLQAAPTILWRASRRTRFEATRRTLTVTTSPLGPRVIVEGWSARAPVVVARESRMGLAFGALPRWDLYSERDDGRRVHLATLHDEESVEFVRQFLTDAFRDAEPNDARHPLAVRFGPMPEGVTCLGDPTDPTKAYRLEARCPRGSLGTEIASSVFLALVGLLMVFATIGTAVVILEGLSSGAGIGLAISVVPFGFVLGMSVLSLRALRDQLRLTILRASGSVSLELADTGVEIDASPWRVRPLKPLARRTSPISLHVAPLERDPHEARVHVAHDGRTVRLHAPLRTDDARYLARVVEEHERERITRGRASAR
ncbi:MAG: hypothetical protein K1X94_00970 [Sandaracinaceae bacterium]|nr:hypothetical protein [Sandaracinaceae bacterium]